jgi:hypothetical protein
MNQDSAVPREIIDQIVAQLERLMDEARDKWSLTKSDDPNRFASWNGREQGYRNALQLLADAGLAPRYATRK